MTRSWKASPSIPKSALLHRLCGPVTSRGPRHGSDSAKVSLRGMSSAYHNGTASRVCMHCLPVLAGSMRVFSAQPPSTLDNGPSVGFLHSRGAFSMWHPFEGRKSKTAERLEVLRREKELAELNQCTFKPAINRRSSALMGERAKSLKTLNLSAHEQLFQDAVRRQIK